ncbi:MAG: EamA family transporter [Clostridia bacterium]|nr:EamA family transporter [Clostridia bacterium]
MMVIAVYVLIILASATQSAATKLFQKHCPYSSVFNTIKAASAFLLFALLSVFGFEFHLPTLIFGSFYGICLSISMYAGYQALCRGPMALTSMLVSFSVIIPLIWGVAVGKETLKMIQYPAFALLIFAMILTNLDKLKIKKESQTNYGVWLLFVGITFLCNGISSILQKQHQTLYPKAYSREFMVFAMLICFVIFLVLAGRRSLPKELKRIKGKCYGVLSGLGNGLASFLTLTLAGMENASILFPIISAGTILAALFCGRVVFREKLKPNHYVAIAAGICAVVLLKL